MSVMDRIWDQLKAFRLPSQSAARLLALVEDSRCSAAEVARVAACDSSLAAHVLKVANSAALSPLHKFESLPRAISYLGLKTVVGIATAYCCASLYDRPLGGYESPRGEFWAHSLRTALAAKEVARFFREGLEPDLAYTAGLLHDIGKAFLSNHLEGLSGRTVSSLDDANASDYLEAERDALGTDHCEVGAALMEMWGLPQSLQEVARKHHEPGSAPVPPPLRTPSTSATSSP